jgi:uncharacterized protein YndB with AHSA1/START domain
MAAENNSNELHLTRVYDAPARVVWDAWTVPEQVAKWWGPRGFTLTTHSKDLRAGGSWRYTMHGPDGTDYPNVTKYFVVEPHHKLVYDHGGTDERPPLFRVTVTFTELNGKTTMDMVSSLPSPAAAKEMAKFIKQAGGNATWDRLAEYLEEAATGNPIFVIHRSFDASAARVLEMWTHAAKLATWLPPSGTEPARLGAQPGGGTATSFIAHGERNTRTTVSLTEEAPARTRVTVTTEPGERTPSELAVFISERPDRTLAWTRSFDALEALLDAGSGA